VIFRENVVVKTATERVTSARGRIYGLDLLRAMAILFVVYGHSCFILAAEYNLKWISIPVFDGVSIFFVLSGFLIGGILIRTFESDEFSVHGLFYFWKRRWFRTLPNYFLILILLIFLNKDPEQDYLAYFFFVQNFYSAHSSFFPEAWSLSVEEWFYMITPLAMLILIKLKLPHRQAILSLCIGLIVFSVGIRLYRYINLDITTLASWDLLIRKQVVTRFDSLIFGVIAAYIAFYHSNIWRENKKRLFIFGVLILTIDRVLGFYRADITGLLGFYFTVTTFLSVAIGTSFLIPLLTSIQLGSGYFYQFMTFISKISYAMYLVNLTLVLGVLLPWITDFMGMEGSGVSTIWIKYFLFWFLTITLSYLIYRFYERPLMNFRN
jgi:peptidoglycan/LPS O-acetylase OafA/YrhL